MDTMAVAASVVAMNRAHLAENIGMAMLKKAIEQSESQAAQLIQLVSQAGGIGQNLNTVG